jgi:hypothetical protein
LLKRYFIRPTTVDRIRASWLGEAIEGYVVWLTEQKYAARNMAFRVPVLVRFGEFAQRSGANKLEELPAHIEPFIEDWLNRRKQGYSESQRSVAARELRNPIRQPTCWRGELRNYARSRPRTLMSSWLPGLVTRRAATTGSLERCEACSIGWWFTKCCL